MPLKKEFISSLASDEIIKDEASFLELLALINEENDVNKQIENGETLLHLATWKGYKNVVVKLLKKGARININDHVSNRTAIHLAVKNNNIEVLKALLETNYDIYFTADFNFFNIKDVDGNTPLMIAEKKGYQEIVNLLNIDSIIGKVKNKMWEQLNQCQYDSEVKALILENFDDCYKRLNNEIKLLDKENKRLQSKKNYWLNVITCGLFHKSINTKILKNNEILLSKRLAFNAKRKKINGTYQAIKEMIAVKEIKQINDKLRWWAVNDNLKIMKQLIELIANDANGNHLHIALIWAVKKGYLEVVQFLLIKGANVNYVDKYGDTALIWATIKERLNIVKVLIANGAKVNHVDKNGDTALTWATIKGNVNIVKALIAFGANVNHIDNYGDTVLTYATKNGNLELLTILCYKGYEQNMNQNLGLLQLPNNLKNKKINYKNVKQKEIPSLQQWCNEVIRKQSNIICFPYLQLAKQLQAFDLNINIAKINAIDLQNQSSTSESQNFRKSSTI